MWVRYPGRTGVWKGWFLGGRKTGEPGEKSLEKSKIQQKNQPICHGDGIEPGPHWWEASALTTVPPIIRSRISGLEQRRSKKLETSIDISHSYLS